MNTVYILKKKIMTEIKKYIKTVKVDHAENYQVLSQYAIKNHKSLASIIAIFDRNEWFCWTKTEQQNVISVYNANEYHIHVWE